MRAEHRTSRLLQLLIATFLVLSLAPLLPAQPSAARNTATIGDDTITITVPVELFWTNELVARGWQHAVDSYWNHDADRGGPFRWCNRDVRFEFDVKLVPRGELPSDDQRHNIFVRHVRPGQYFVNRVFYGRPRDQYDPTRHRAGGEWRYDAWDDVIAHEFGHLLGLRDEYRRVERDGRRVSEPLPGRERSIMGNPPNGRVFQKHIDVVMDKHHIGCGLHVVYHHEITHDSGFEDRSDNIRAFVDFFIELRETEPGVLEGQGEAVNFDWTRRALFYPGNCEYYADLSEEAFIPDFPVTGAREGDTVSVTLPDNLNVGVLADFHNECGSEPISRLGEPRRFPYLREIEGQLIDSRYEDDRTEEHPLPNQDPSPFKIRHYILIVEDFPHHRRGGD